MCSEDFCDSTVQQNHLTQSQFYDAVVSYHISLDQEKNKIQNSKYDFY